MRRLLELHPTPSQRAPALAFPREEERLAVRPTPMPQPTLLALFASLVPLGAVLTGCASSGQSEPETRPYVPLPDPEPESIGFFLTEFDASVRAWTNLELSGRSSREQRMRRGLEKEMGQRARKRQEELLSELRSGPPTNRAVAAVALGFTGDPAVVGPLYEALLDPSDDVVHNALLGLGRLGSPDTPTTEICYLLRNDADPWIRNNAAFALQTIVAAGGEPSDLLRRSAREALGDQEPGVRAQCASVLGLAHDADAIEELGDLIYDETPLVSAAAITALGSIGRYRPESKGRCARFLAQALDRVGPKQREFLVSELARMSEVHLGDDPEPWLEWAARLP